MRFLLLVLPLALIACSSSEPESFIDKAAKEPGAIKTPSGLVYKVIQTGMGASPKATDMVKVNYRGTLTDGTEFDSSDKHGGPQAFPLNRVISCWTEGVQLMRVGGKAQLVCPGYMAYREEGSPPLIGPNAVLVFQIELLDIGS